MLPTSKWGCLALTTACHLAAARRQVVQCEWHMTTFRRMLNQAVVCKTMGMMTHALTTM